MHLTPHMAFKNAPLNKKGKVCKKGKTNKHITSSCNRAQGFLKARLFLQFLLKETLLISRHSQNLLHTKRTYQQGWNFVMECPWLKPNSLLQRMYLHK
jgi:hypothetical protein